MKSADPPTLLRTSDAFEPKYKGRHSRWSEAGWWAWEDLNLRLHPYQQSGAYRYATLRFRRSLPTVRGEVMRSNNLTRSGDGRAPSPSR
jgi:hypothetical protein